MSAFFTNGPGWYVSDLDDSPNGYPVFTVWRGRKLCGVAGGFDGVNDLIESAARDGAKESNTQRGVTSIDLIVRVSTRRVTKTWRTHVQLRWFEGSADVPKAWLIEKVSKVRVADGKGRSR